MDDADSHILSFRGCLTNCSRDVLRHISTHGQLALFGVTLSVSLTDNEQIMQVEHKLDAAKDSIFINSLYLFMRFGVIVDVEIQRLDDILRRHGELTTKSQTYL